uniref:uncharacterized protein n=1 Tax=Myxine glutinosa TaxID=7769 RepID=UPI0035900AD0
MVFLTRVAKCRLLYHILVLKNKCVSTLRKARKQHLANLKAELSNLSPSKTWWHLVTCLWTLIKIKICLIKKPKTSVQNNIKLTLFNTRSLNNKCLILNEYILDNKLDFLCLTETWQQPLDYYTLNLTTPNGYSYVNKPRSEGRGGGIAVIHRQDIKTNLISISSAPSFEHLALKLSGHTQSVMAVVYRPPKPHPSFLSDFSYFLTQLCSLSPSILLLGDFNIHMDSTDSTITTDFTDLLTCFNLTQHVDFPTHIRGHILDLVCSTGLNLHHLYGSDLTLSDHLAITLTINIPAPTPRHYRTINFRK